MSFSDFWQAYPRRVAKADARKAWDKLKPSPEVEAQILAALDWQRTVWDDPKYTPYPATYLRGERWEDEPPTTLSIGSGRAAATIHEARAALAALEAHDGRGEESTDRSLDAVGDCDPRESRPRRLRAVS